MSPIAFELLAVALIILLSLSLSRVSHKIGLPTLLIFIGLGMLFGEDGLLKIQFDNYSLSEQVCSVCLVIIVFYGGFGTSWKNAKPTARVSVLLSSLGTVLTALLTGVFCHFVMGLSWLSGLLVGAVISSTDAASVFSILRSRKLSLRYGTASVLEVESGSNDPFAYMLTVILLSVMNGEAGFWPMLLMLFKQLAFSAVIGPLVALGIGWMMRHVRFRDDGYDSILIFGAAFLSYGVSAALGGNGYLSVYLTGIILGNRPLRGKRTLVHFFDGVTGLMQILVFFLLGLLATPSALPKVFLPGMLIALFLTFVSRPAAVFAVMQPAKSPLRQQLLVSWCGLRGASSIVFAIMATVMSDGTPDQLFNLVFFIVLFSITVQGTLIPLIAGRLQMIDAEGDVMKTFSDYTEQVPVQYLKLRVDERHAWAHRELKSLQMLPQTRVALILRGREQLIPRGDTRIEPGDSLIVSGPAFDGSSIGTLTELRITPKHEWCGEALRDIRMEETRLIIMVLRGTEAIIPVGDTVLLPGDVLVMNELKTAPLPALHPRRPEEAPGPAAAAPEAPDAPAAEARNGQEETPEAPEQSGPEISPKEPLSGSSGPADSSEPSDISGSSETAGPPGSPDPPGSPEPSGTAGPDRPVTQSCPPAPDASPAD